MTSTRLSQAPIEVASAKPTCASDPISATLQATLTATAISDALTGVAVSPRARNVAVTLRMSTNGSRPNAYAAKVRPAAVASAAVKAPRRNNARMMRSGIARNATTHGIDSSSVSSIARFCACRAPASSPAAIRPAISGSSTVPTAMPITPIGSWVNRAAQDRRGGGRRETRKRVQDAAVGRDQRHQQQIGKGDARELDRQRETAGVAGKARRQQRDHRRSEDEGKREQDELAREQQREHA